ncbi:LytTR family DNA-binding domain-containing protein [Porphyromonadaceae bacterium OttesenSCG-928-L07]|nr:LytTR family DNA-binding domain-containing protein [Porphyromonadaceae bacterium OttesenSCG-928-L07]MDL2252019.1 LytTR family DNA-binding domain-containing protein [Odoribacter sp. OttesenSCG-928-J03]MDL2282994.1 LytTR family DNA-binding domain-containing protein [Odoribacter sp. OttesenSCG-928-G04]MDL2331112.1 LytTR family DNA-binding domain-containing protein [Odoribacter sp. OttesenSCG-928-A06]
MISCIAIDDEPLALTQIKSYIEKTPFLKLMGAYSSALEAMEAVGKERPDLLFVDINMPGLSGMEYVKSLQERPLVIFTTAYSEYALEGFKVDALDYLLKPIGYNDFLRSATKALKQYELLNKEEKVEATDSYLFVKADYKMVKVYINAITYIESRSEYIRIHLDTDKPLMTLLSLKNVEEYLPATKFMRVHRSYIVNLEKIDAVSRGSIVIGGETIPVGDLYREAFSAYVDRNSVGRL